MKKSSNFAGVFRARNEACYARRVNLGTLLVVVFALTACGGGDDDGGGGEPDGGGGDPADAGPCGAFEPPAVPWLDDALEDTVSRLSGAEEITPGVTLADRATDGNRAVARDYLVAQLQSAGLDAQLHDYGGGINVWATMAGEGGADGGAVLLGAHYDSVPDGPGANDNATGVAVVLAAARYLGEVDCRKRDVIVAFFDEEELGLIGSMELAVQLVADDVEIEAVHTIDQLGWDEDDDGVMELEKPGAGLVALYQEAIAAGGHDASVSPTTTSTSDHEAFRQAGMNAVGISEEYVGGDTTPYYHTDDDTFPTVDLAYLSSSARVVLHAIALQARR